MYWFLKYCVIGPVVRFVARPRVTGAHHVPRSGPLIVAANHLAEIDSLVLGAMLPRPIRFLAKQEYFTGRAGALVYRALCRVTGQIPVDRDDGRHARDALATARDILAEGQVWAIYPEGTRSPDGRLHRGRTGAMRVALATGAPVVPVALVGTDRVDPASSRGWRRGRVEVRIGPPLDLRGFADDPSGWRGSTDALMRQLAALSGQEYVDQYARRPSSVRASRTRSEAVGGDLYADGDSPSPPPYS